MTTNLPVELSGYQAAAADLARIVADLRVLPGAEKPPYLALSILPEKSVEAVDTVALAVLGKRGATRRDSDGWRHIAEGRVGAVFVSVHAVVPGPPDERDLELESLRAEVEELRADRVGQLYSREADDPTPVSGARVEPHVGGMTDGGLVDETPEQSAAIVDQNLRAMGSEGLVDETDGHFYIGDGLSGCDELLAGKVRCGAGRALHPLAVTIGGLVDETPVEPVHMDFTTGESMCGLAATTPHKRSLGWRHVTCKACISQADES